ncbi:hypothetical protein ACHRV1_24860 [Flavobacterium aquidurense]|uniref:hypothetical protein n=1 Tax=Flavobacterium aquidurense TaxID=362413 RepID=UPI00375782D5
MTRLPIYQMMYDMGGLKFPSESDDDSNQGVVFLIQKFSDGAEIGNISDLVVYFPFDINDSYYELESKIENSMISFIPPKFSIPIRFRIDYNMMFKFTNYGEQDLKYSGRVPFRKGENSFLVVYPLDLEIMDEMYFETKGIFVGLTPTFGEGGDIIFDFKQ